MEKEERQLGEWRMVGIEGEAVNLFVCVSMGTLNEREGRGDKGRTEN